jgi:hypothetical protein
MADRYSTARTAHEIMIDDQIMEGVRGTEREILADALGEQEPDYQSSEFLAEQSQTEGWDGDYLSDAEQAYSALHGYGANNFDRSIAMSEQLELAAENKRLQDQVKAYEGFYEEQHAAPQREAQRQQMRDQVRSQLADRYGLHDLEVDNAKIDRFISDVVGDQQRTQQLDQHRVNQSLARAHQAYGADFEDAYNDITSMRQDSPIARQIVSDIWNSPDPGARVMQHHNSQFVQSMSRHHPPFMAGDRQPVERAPRGSMRRGGDWDSAAGFGDRDIEADVFNSTVWDG